MGASAALFLSRVLRIPSHVIAFNAQTNPDQDSRLKFWLAGRLLPKEIREGYTEYMRHSIDSSNAHTWLLTSFDPHEIQQAEYVSRKGEDMENTEVVTSYIEDSRNIEDIYGREIKHNGGRMEVKIYKDCKEHALLRHLRDNDSLIPFLNLLYRSLLSLH